MPQITINRARRNVDADPHMPLLWVIREILALTGTKFGCGIGACGACTVHLDEQAVRSCITPLSVAAGHEIVTIEGLSPDGTHPVQQAWRANNVPQCGYCQPRADHTGHGSAQIDPNPTYQQITDAMWGNVLPLRHIRADPRCHQISSGGNLIIRIIHFSRCEIVASGVAAAGSDFAKFQRWRPMRRRARPSNPMST
jgi:isoquinoline 1-oxidoreductase subunit alpha